MFLAFIIGLFVLGTFIGVASLFGEMKNSTWNIQTPVQTKDSSNINGRCASPAEEVQLTRLSLSASCYHPQILNSPHQLAFCHVQWAPASKRFPVLKSPPAQ